ncbi:MAG: type II secretion system minor pseudopilin GspH [Glaciecola sp.]|nr:type II secretion system minor pseudopilin GspH [Glaciecola sp.]MDG1816531.1 type II secretion system minor pseudopilin GspH [Glaciecola sp.]MDG2098796.1 type II secretion system minor pseudopilin GspH [Glaciecola sp.]
MNRAQRQSGFTLIEIMLVLVIMGLVAAYVVVNAFGTNPSDKLKTEAQRFHAIATMASDFAVLNQLQFGLVIDDQRKSYHFVTLDDTDNWVPVEQNKAFTERELDSNYAVKLQLDGFEWESEDSLFTDNALFDETLSVSSDGVQIGNEEDIPPPPPQILFLSSGDVTEFTLTFEFADPQLGDDTFSVSSQGYLPLLHDLTISNSVVDNIANKERP